MPLDDLEMLVCTLAFVGLIHVVGNEINAHRNNSVYSSDSHIYSSLEKFTPVFEEERRKIGLEEVDINLKIDNNIESATLNYSEPYTITFNSKYLKRKVLKHELFHLKELRSAWEFLHTFPILEYIGEWRATSYSSE